MTFSARAIDGYSPRVRSSFFRDLSIVAATAGAAALSVVVLSHGLSGPQTLRIETAAYPGLRAAASRLPLAALTAIPERSAFPFSQSAPLRAGFQRTILSANTAPVVVASLETDAAAQLPAPFTAATDAAAATLPEPRPADLDVVPPLPVPRPAELAVIGRQPLRRVATGPDAIAPAPVAPKAPGLFERLFGGSSEPSGPALAYANPQDGLGLPKFGGSPNVAVSPDRTTAVYDISARIVYMPDGTRLEAHSGLGDMLDKPEHVHVKMRGATPPAVYDLKLREKLFHGVEAIRLTPLNSGVYGRVGLLAHTYMLGPNGDSNGCVSFRNYDAFLQAFKRGQITRLAVVTRSN